MRTRDPRSGGAQGLDGRYNARRSGTPGPHAHGNVARQVVDDRRAQVCGQRKPSVDPRHIQHSPGTPTTALRKRGNDTSGSTGRSGRQNAAPRRNMRRDDRVTVQGPVKEQRDGLSHGAGAGAGAVGCPWVPCTAGSGNGALLCLCAGPRPLHPQRPGPWPSLSAVLLLSGAVAAFLRLRPAWTRPPPTKWAALALGSRAHAHTRRRRPIIVRFAGVPRGLRCGEGARGPPAPVRAVHAPSAGDPLFVAFRAQPQGPPGLAGPRARSRAEERRDQLAVAAGGGGGPSVQRVRYDPRRGPAVP